MSVKSLQIRGPIENSSKKLTIQSSEFAKYFEKELNSSGENVSLTIFEASEELELTTVNRETFLSQGDYRKKIIKEIENKARLASYDDPAELENFINVLSKTICLETIISQGNIENLDLNTSLPVVYISKIIAQRTLNRNNNFTQANKKVREKHSENIAEDTDFFESFFENLIDLKRENQNLYCLLLREVTHECCSRINLSEELYQHNKNTQLGYYYSNGHYNPNQTRNNLDFAFLDQEITFDYLVKLFRPEIEDIEDIVEIEIEEEYNDYETPKNPLYEIVSNNDFLSQLILSEDYNFSNFEDRIQILHDILQLLLEKRNYKITNKNPNTGQTHKFRTTPNIVGSYSLQELIKKYDELFKDLKKAIHTRKLNPKTNLKEVKKENYLEKETAIDTKAEFITSENEADNISAGIVDIVKGILESNPVCHHNEIIKAIIDEAKEKIPSSVLTVLVDQLILNYPELRVTIESHNSESDFDSEDFELL
ncbi:hypothetical protein HOL52_02190 [bacterium]|nr:hypothetical protein [bacterium]